MEKNQPQLPAIDLGGLSKSITALADSAKQLKTIRHEIAIDSNTMAGLRTAGGYAAALILFVVFVVAIFRKGGQK